MISLLILMAVIGLVAWLLTAYVPMPQAIRTVIIVVAVIFVIVLALRACGAWGTVSDVPVPQVR